jgi:hypothetical protein
MTIFFPTITLKLSTMKKKRWSAQEKEFVFNNLGKISTKEMAIQLGKTEVSVNLFLLRKRTSPKAVVKNNMVLMILQYAFVNPEYFTPTRTFYDAVKIGQKRWWSLYKGVKRATDEECLRIASHLGVDTSAFFESRQLNFFEIENK